MQYENVRNATGDSSDGIDYKSYTNNILHVGANQSIALVTYVDNTAKRAILVYGLKKRASVKLADLKLKLKAGSLIKIYWEENGADRINVLGADAQKISDIENLSYLKRLEGKITKLDGKSFAFFKIDNINCYINPTLVENNKLSNGDNVSILSVLDYNKKKEEWVWNSITLRKMESKTIK